MQHHEGVGLMFGWESYSTFAPSQATGLIVHQDSFENSAAMTWNVSWEFTCSESRKPTGALKKAQTDRLRLRSTGRDSGRKLLI
jgi:hypothetical protein